MFPSIPTLALTSFSTGLFPKNEVALASADRILFQRFNNRTAVSLNSNKSNRTCVFLRRQISVYSVSLRSLGSFFGSPSHTTLHFLLLSSVSTCQMSWNLYSLHLFKKTVSCEYSCETRKLRDQNYRQRFRHVCLEKNFITHPLLTNSIVIMKSKTN